MIYALLTPKWLAAYLFTPILYQIARFLIVKFSPDYLLPASANDPNYAAQFSNAGAGIFHGQIVNDAFCDLILSRIKQHENSDVVNQITQANSMHKNAILTNEIGLEPFISSFTNFFFKKIAPDVLPGALLKTIDSIHSYVVRYGISLDRDLGFHVDDSFLTINLCLNDGFVGSDLQFEGQRCTTHIDTLSGEHERVLIKHKKGKMILHHGKNRHYVETIRKGERFNLIIWCQNKSERAQWFDATKNQKCPDWCSYTS